MADPTREIVELALRRVLTRQQRACDPSRAGAGDDAPMVRAGLPVAIASDHGGFAMKEALAAFLRAQGYAVRDLGPGSADACDYPDYALKVARLVATGEAARGIMIDGVGIGSAIAATKVPGVRAATCFNVPSTVNSRGHNNANVMCIGSSMLSGTDAEAMALVFLETEFEGGRHARRVDKIAAIEQTFTRPQMARLQ